MPTRTPLPRTNGLRTTRFAAAALLLALNAPGSAATLSIADLTPNDIVITEYLANPVGISDTSGEYFEIFNTTPNDIDLAGLVIRDDGSNTFTVSSLLLTAGQFAVFANADGAALGLTPAYVYGSAMALTNSDDEIGLYRPDDMLINKVVYSDGDSFGAGIAHELDVLSSSLPNVTTGPAAGSHFVAATATLNLGNFGSPGTAGNTLLDAPAVPLPAGIWMLGSALSMLCWMPIRRLAGCQPTGVGDDKLHDYPGPTRTRAVQPPSAAQGAARGAADYGRYGGSFGDCSGGRARV